MKENIRKVFLRRTLLSLSILFILGSCRESLFEEPLNSTENTSNTSHKTRSVDEIKELALYFYDNLGEENELKASVETPPQKSSLSIDVFTLDQISDEEDNSKFSASINGKPTKPKNDTLLYYVGFQGNGGMLLSGNEESTPLLAILDDGDFSFKEVLSDPEKNEGILAFLSTAAEYNKNPEAFEKIINSSEEGKVDPEAGLFSRFKIKFRWDFWRKRKREDPPPVYLVDQVAPKVKVEWGQGSPYNRYTPNNYPAGCVATAVAQAMTVTRHIRNFDGLELNYNDLVKFKKSEKYYLNKYPKQADIIGQLIYKIGVNVGMNYGAGGSGANTEYAVNKIFRDRGMNVNRNKANIKTVLKYYYNNGIIIVTSRTKKNNIWGSKRGEGHAYIADGYLQYSDGSDLIHVNMGWNGGSNGYYLSNLMSPHWIDEANEAKHLKHSWDFYCIYK